MNDEPAITPPPPPRAEKKSLRFTGKCMLIAVEMVMVVIGLCIIGGGILTWRLSGGPIEVGFARKYIESELSDPVNHLAMALDSVFLEWSLTEGRPVITLRNVRLINTENDKVAFSFESASVGLARRALLLGQVVPRTITIHRPLIALVRDADNTIRLGFNQALPEDNEAGDLFKVLDDLARPSNEAPRNWPLRNLQSIMITDARMMIEDHVLNQSWLVPKIEMAFLRNPTELELTSALWLESDLAQKPTLETRALYYGRQEGLSVQANVQGLRASFLAAKYPHLEWLSGQNVILNGTAQVRLDPGMILTQLDATLASKNGQLTIPDIYNGAFPYQSLQLNMSYNDAARTLTLRDSPVVVNDDFKFSLSGTATEDAQGLIQAPVKLHIDTLTHEQVVAFWPTALKGQSSEKWALHRVSNGRITNSDINAVLAVTKTETMEGAEQKVDWSVDLASMNIDFALEGVDLDYSAPLMPLREASGTGQYDYATDKLVIQVTKGVLGDLAVQSGTVSIDTVYGDGIGTAIIDAVFSGPLKTVFQYIASEPIGVDSLPTDITKIEGDAEFSLNVTLPTAADLPADQIIVSAEGTAKNVLLPGLVNGLDVSGGPVSIKVKDGHVEVAGKAKVDGRDADFTYSQFFNSKGKPYSGQVVADIVVDKGLRDHFGIDLSDWMDGGFPSKITYTEFGGGRTEISAVVDATPGSLFVKPMQYTKLPGAPGKASLKAVLEKGVLKTISNLVIEGPELRAEGGTMNFAQEGKETQLRSGKFTRTRLRETDVAVDFTLSAKKHLDLNFKGSFFDATPFLANNNPPADNAKQTGTPYKGPSLVARVDVPRMRTAEARVVTDAKIYVDMDRQGTLQTLDMDAKAGQGSIVFRYRPEPRANKMTLRIESDDAGAALQAFDVYENIQGGTMLVTGESAPGGNPKIVLGMGALTNFKVVNAPVLARMINALSLPGIMQLLGSDGISFTKLESEFAWEILPGGNIFSFRNGRTAGASVGLTFEGNVNGLTDTIAINGTIVPMSMVNNFLGSIPLVGDILTGGSAGGVFAATYSVRGPAKSPTTMVNPLAVLTPGFLRRIFFE